MQDKPSQTAGIANRPPPNIKISARGMRSRYFQEKPSQTAGIAHPKGVGIALERLTKI